MNALFLWKKEFTVLKDINSYFRKVFYLSEYEVNIENLLEFLILNEISIVVIQNPFFNEKRLAIYRYLRLKEIKVLASDRGALPDSWFFDLNGFNSESSSYDTKYWDKPLSKENEELVSLYIRKECENDKALEKQGQRIGKKKLIEKLNLPPEKKFLFVPLQRPSDTVIKYFSKNIKGIEEFLKIIIEVQKKLKDEWMILVKKHPLENEKLFEDTLFYVDDNIHFKDLLELSNAVALINSGVGLISMLFSKPVYHFGDAFYSNLHINREVKTCDELVFSLKEENFKVDIEKVKRFIFYLINNFYSFGNFITEEKVMEDKSKRTITNKIDFYKINIAV